MYAHLIAGADAKGREEFDRDLLAPAGGFAALQHRFLTYVQEGGDDDG